MLEGIRGNLSLADFAVLHQRRPEEPEYYALVNPDAGRGIIMANDLPAAEKLVELYAKQVQIQAGIRTRINPKNARLMVTADSMTIRWFAERMNVSVDNLTFESSGH